MSISKLEEFVDVYMGSVVEVIQNKDSLSLDDFYSHIFDRVLEITGLTQEKVKYLHHAFHWSLFLRNPPYLEIFIPRGNGGVCQVKQKMPVLEKSKLIENVLRENKIWLQERWANLAR